MATETHRPPGKRARARAEQSARILQIAGEQLRHVGADALSLRAVARELGVVSSAVYRYYASRDELLTALITESYDELAAAAAAAGAQHRAAGHRAEFIGVCAGIRGWARAHPHRWALLYGSPVPGYRAPESTIAHARGVLDALVAPVVAAGPERSPAGAPHPTGLLAEQAAVVRQALGLGDGAGDDLVIALGISWAAVIGTVSAELFGQFANTFDPADELATVVWGQLADRVGLRAG